MKPYIFSLLAGMLAGVIYGTTGVHSPAPPTVALTGLLGMLAGEQNFGAVQHFCFWRVLWRVEMKNGPRGPYSLMSWRREGDSNPR